MARAPSYIALFTECCEAWGRMAPAPPAPSLSTRLRQSLQVSKEKFTCQPEERDQTIVRYEQTIPRMASCMYIYY